MDFIPNLDDDNKTDTSSMLNEHINQFNIKTEIEQDD